MAPLLVLLAEDDPDDAFFLKEALTRFCPGVLLRQVQDGQEAIEYLSGEGRFADRSAYPLPAHLLLDMKLPRRSGLEVLRWIRTRSELRSLPVTIMSGSRLAQDVEDAKALGVASYIVKAVDLREFERSVAGFCGKLKRA